MSWILLVLAHWNNCPRIDMSLNTDTLFWFRVNQSVLFLLNDACLAEKQQIPIFIVSGLTRPGLEPTSYRTQSGHANHYPADAVWIRMVMKSIYLFFTRQWYRCRIIHVSMWNAVFCNYDYSCTGFIWAGNGQCLDKCLRHTITDQDIVILIHVERR